MYFIHTQLTPTTIGEEYLLSSHLESYFNVRLKLYSLRPLVKLYRSVRKITVSALVNSAFVPEYCEQKKMKSALKYLCDLQNFFLKEKVDLNLDLIDLCSNCEFTLNIVTTSVIQDGV